MYLTRLFLKKNVHEILMRIFFLLSNVKCLIFYANNTTYFIFLLIDGRNIDMGKRFSLVSIMFSVTAFVKVYVLGQSSRILLFGRII